jgi:hypothetical protein
MKFMQRMRMGDVEICSYCRCASRDVVNAEVSIDAKDMIQETGCASKFSEEKKNDIYARKYKNERMFVVGEISYINKGSLGVKILRATLTYDVLITMRDPKDTYEIEKGDVKAVIFTSDNIAGGCILPYTGKDGVIAKTN